MSSQVPAEENGVRYGSVPPRFDERTFDDSEIENEFESEPANRVVVPSKTYYEDAEEALLSAMLADPEAIAQVRALGLRSEDFFERKHQLVFRALMDVDERGQAVDPVTLSVALGSDLSTVGGKDFIGYLIDVVPTAANAQYHAEIVLDAAKRRMLADSLESNARALRDGKARVGEVATRLLPALETLVPGLTDQANIFLDDEQIADVKEPPALVEGILPSNCLAQLFGPSGSYKSFAALDLACHIAAGMDWHGHPVRRGPVVYIVAEGGFGMRNRVAAWKRYHNYSGKLGVYFFLSRVAINASQPDVRALISTIKRELSPAEIASLALIIIDTKARNFVGNENATEDENGYVAGCDQLRRAFDEAVLSVHHTGWEKEDRGRGSSAAYAALDTELRCIRDGSRLTIHCSKQKDADEFPDLAFEVVGVGKSLVLKAMDQAGGKLDGNRLLCLQALHRLEGRGTYSQWRKEAGLEKKNSAFSTVRNWLLAAAYVKSGAEKKYSVTDAGRMALSPLSIVSPSSVHPTPVNASPSRGGLEDPAMDQTRGTDAKIERPV